MNKISYDKLKEKTIVVTKTPLPGYNFTNILQLLIIILKLVWVCPQHQYKTLSFIKYSKSVANA